MENAEKIKLKKSLIKPQSSLQKGIPFYRKGLSFGIISGIGMGLFLMLINLATEGIHTGWSLAKYLVLGAVLGVALSQIKKASPLGKTFKNGTIFGAFISFIAAIMLIIINTVISITGIEAIITQRYNLEADSLANIMIIDGVLFFECMVFGMILTFIWLQFFKEPKPTE